METNPLLLNDAIEDFMIVAISVVVNTILAAAVAKKMWIKFCFARNNNFIFLFFIFIFSAVIGLIVPIVIFALVEFLGFVVSMPGLLLTKMIGFGFWCSILGSYFGLRDARKSSAINFELNKNPDDMVGSDLPLNDGFANLNNQSHEQKVGNFKLSKDSKTWLFWTVFWAMSVLLYTWGLDPFDNGSWNYMDDDEYSTLFFVMFVPPLFLFVSKKIYDRFIKDDE